MIRAQTLIEMMRDYAATFDKIDQPVAAHMLREGAAVITALVARVAELENNAMLAAKTVLYSEAQVDRWAGKLLRAISPDDHTCPWCASKLIDVDTPAEATPPRRKCHGCGFWVSLSALAEME